MLRRTRELVKSASSASWQIRRTGSPKLCFGKCVQSYILGFNTIYFIHEAQVFIALCKEHIYGRLKKSKHMKNFIILMIFSVLFILFACKKEETSQRFNFLTGHVWESDSLLANGADESDGVLKNFKGDAKFNVDGTGYFGKYEGTWKFAYDETQLVISSDSLPVPSITAEIIELNDVSLKVTTGFPGNPPLSVRMTFTAK
jgi:hypothetical protein